MVSGRLYGPSLFPAALDLVYAAAKAGIPIIGAGGVVSHCRGGGHDGGRRNRRPDGFATLAARRNKKSLVMMTRLFGLVEV